MASDDLNGNGAAIREGLAAIREQLKSIQNDQRQLGERANVTERAIGQLEQLLGFQTESVGAVTKLLWTDQPTLPTQIAENRQAVQFNRLLIVAGLAMQGLILEEITIGFLRKLAGG